MNGWETRRRNGGYDHVIVKLGLPRIIKGIDIDTRNFTGNFALTTSLKACNSSSALDQNTQWVMFSLQGHRHHYFEIDAGLTFSHLRLNLYPDSGVARVRVDNPLPCNCLK